MRVLHTVAPARFGGLESVVMEVTAGLAGLGHDVALLSVTEPHATENAFDQEVENRGVQLYPVSVEPRHYAQEIREVRRVARAFNPDLVHMHGYRPCVVHWLALRSFGPKLVTTLHGFTGGSVRNRLYEFAQIRVSRRLDAVIGVSRPIIDRVQRAGAREDRVFLIQNGFGSTRVLSPIAARRELGVPPDAFHIGWVGRLSAEKGPDVFLEAVKLVESRSGLVASVIGDGPMRSDLEARGTHLTRPLVRFHGVISTAAQLMSAFDVFVLSSRTEGTPMVLLEAMAASVPIVATAVGGVPDVVSEETAILVPPDDPAALARAIEQVRADPDAARARARRAKDDLETRFSMEAWLGAYERVYEEVVHR